jgi:hypothetical protein
MIFLLCGYGRAILDAASCEKLDSTVLSLANDLASDVNKELVGDGKPFTRVAEGVLVTIVNSESGAADGGATNPDGSYAVTYFVAEDVFQNTNACDIQACSNSTSTMNCHNRCNKSPDGIEITMGYMLGPSDAVVFTGCTPTPLKYFAMDTYITSRLGSKDQKYPFYPGQNFGDTINNQNINLVDKEAIFNQPTVMIQTADGAAADAVTAAYAKAGFDPKGVSVRAIDSDYVRMWDRSVSGEWDASGPDFLLSFMRMSIPTEGTRDAFEKYQRISWPVKLYFAADDKKPESPLHPELISRTSPLNEITMYKSGMDSFEEDLIQLYNITNHMDIQCATELKMQNVGTYDDWQMVLEAGNNDTFVLPSRDATYGTVPPGVSCIPFVEPKNIGVIFGAIHTETLQLSYSSVSFAVLNGISKKILGTLAFVVDLDTYKGSALRYMSEETIANIEASGGDPSNIYAVDIRGPGECSEVSATCMEYDESYCKGTGLRFGILGERMYASKITTIGPSSDQTLAARAVFFNP